MDMNNNVTNALDIKNLDDIKRQVRQGDSNANRKVAREFEAMFLNIILKGMRDALPHSDPLESDASRLGTSLLDEQISRNLANRGLGLAEALVKQMEQHGANIQTDLLSNEKKSIPLKALDPLPIPLKQEVPLKNVSIQQDFMNKNSDAAIKAAAETGLPAKFILGQAALESGWGKKEIKDINTGAESFNLFGIKAGKGWKGRTVDAVTTEYINGVPQKIIQKFRAYSSREDAFKDYASLITNNSRYEKALQAADDPVKFAKEMSRAGYATDPKYSEKLARIYATSMKNIG